MQEAVVTSDDPLLMQEAVVTSESAGKLYYGKEGKLTFFNSETGFYTMVTTSGVFQIKPEWLQLKSSKPFVARVQWPKWSQLSKNDLQLWLSQLSCNPEDQLGMGPEEWSTHSVLPCPEKIPGMEDQHLWFGWCLLSWCFKKAKLSQPEEFGMQCVDPILSRLLLENENNPEQLAGLRQGISNSWAQNTRLLFVPVYSQFHWTLLVAQRDLGQPITWRRYDSLSKEHEESHPQQILMGSLLDPQFILPPLSNFAKQPKGSNACGCYVLHHIEEEISLFRGEWPSVWPETGWKNWKQRLEIACNKAIAEQKQITDAAKMRWEKFQVEKTKIAELAEKAKAKLPKLKDITSVAYITAQQQLDKNSVRFTWKNLSQDSVYKVKLLKDAFGRCSKCRWQSGCLNCDAYKCLRYHLHREAAKAKKLPFLSTGPEDLEQLLKSATLAISASPSLEPISSSSAASTSATSAAPA